MKCLYLTYKWFLCSTTLFQGALFLALVPGCQTAVVIDPAIVKGKDGVQKAWSPFWEIPANSLDSGNKAGFKKKELRYRHECLRTGLRDELDCILHKNKYAKKYGRSSSPPSSTNILVVACHACQHLTDETLQIASEYGVNVAVMPCCQKDHDGWWKGLTKRLVKSNGKKSSSLSIGAIMDLLAAGKMMAWNTGATAGVKYRVKMKLMDENISPLQNRMIICRAENRGNDGSGEEDAAKELAHQKLARAYRRAHRVPKDTEKEVATPAMTSKEITVGHYFSHTQSWLCIPSLLTGFSIGAAMSLFVVTFQIRNR